MYVHHSNSRDSFSSPFSVEFLETLSNYACFQCVRHPKDLLSDLERALTLIPTSRRSILILGTGGSSLGAQTLCALRYSHQLIFCETLDPSYLAHLRESLNPHETQVIAISKSGNTSETLMQLLFFCDSWKEYSLSIKEHFIVLTENIQTALGEFASLYKCPVVLHPNVGGRFSVLTLVGLLPAALGGISVPKVLEGAKIGLDTFLSSPCSPPLEGAFHQWKLLQKGVDQTVLMTYGHRLSPFTLWYRQLWAESLGKEGKGSTPIPAHGPMDQHSQLQLYLDGPFNKFFTLLSYEMEKMTEFSSPSTFSHPSLVALEGYGPLEMMRAYVKGTLETLRQKERPVRMLHLQTLDERSMGYLIVHYLIETFAMAWLLNVSPFDQPEIEHNKRLIYHYLHHPIP